MNSIFLKAYNEVVVKGERLSMSIRYYFAATLVALTILAKVSQNFFAEESHIIRRVPTNQKVIALTFDDGPNVKTTYEILKILKEKNVKATFFVLGENVAVHPEILQKAKEEGHEIASHSYTHRYLNKLSQEECSDEMDQAEKIIEQYATKPILFRPPGGLYDDKVIEEAQKRNYNVILWSIDTLDWQRPSVNSVVKAVTTKVKPGDIVLMHDGLYPMPTPKALPIIIDKLRANKYSIVTVGELLKYEELKETGKF